MSYQQYESKAVDAIKKAIPSSLKSNMLEKSKGMFAELFETSAVPNHYVACAIDGIGTKIIIAEAMGIYDTIGIDLVAMSSNDLATLGNVSPFLFMDYLACQSKLQEKKITGSIIKGIVRGLEMADASTALRNSIKLQFGKGETASVDELISAAREGYGFDIAGCLIGFADKAYADEQKVMDGDLIIALPSSGAHSNGYTDLRYHLLKGDFETRNEFKRKYKGRFSLEHDFNGTTIGQALLEPTRIYNKTVAAIAKSHSIQGVNNTGYGLKNLNRIPGFEFHIKNPLKPLPIFDLMQKESKFNDEQMYSTFNMGMGFFIICRKNEAESIVQKTKNGIIVGHAKKSGQGKTILYSENKKIIFEGY